MIVSFGDRATEELYHGEVSRHTRRFPAALVLVALRKLDMVEAARRLEDLRLPPGNRLEALRGAWEGFYSIRVNDRWRLVFRWSNGRAAEVRLVDYH